MSSQFSKVGRYVRRPAIVTAVYCGDLQDVHKFLNDHGVRFMMYAGQCIIQDSRGYEIERAIRDEYIVIDEHGQLSVWDPIRFQEWFEPAQPWEIGQ